MLFFYCALICLIRPLLAVELSIYKSFTEVRQLHNGINEYTYSFTNDEYGNIIHGSISWDGTPFLRQEVYNTIESLKGAQVTVRRSTLCECQTIQAKIIDPNSMLLEDLETGAYFYADKRSVEYTSTRPNDGGTTLTFQFVTEHNGTLSYLMRGITWAPNYDLFFASNDDCKLRAYANIKNNQQREYTVENTRLLGGAVQLATDSAQSGGGYDQGLPDVMEASKVRPDGEQQGVYSYSLNDKYTLRPSSSIRLPFIDIIAKCRFYYKTSISFTAGQYQGVFQRNYDLTPDHFMPAGIITIRDNKILVGQSNLPDVPENYTQTISVGRDNDVRYLVKGNLTSKSNNTAPAQWQTYELDVQIMNFKNKPVDTEIVFQGYGQITLHSTTCESVNVNGNQLNLPFQLQQGEKRQCKFNLTQRWA